MFKLKGQFFSQVAIFALNNQTIYVIEQHMQALAEWRNYLLGCLWSNTKNTAVLPNGVVCDCV